MRLPNKIYLPPLPYNLDSLEPTINQDVLHTHYYGHHKGYVDKYNKLIELPVKNKEDLEFNYNGHLLHSLYWNSISPAVQRPVGNLKQHLRSQFGADFENILKEKLIKLATSVKGSGWAVLALDVNSDLLRIRTIPNHQLEIINNMIPLLVIDSWEHAYYLQYKNKRDTFINAFYSLLNWEQAEERYNKS